MAITTLMQAELGLQLPHQYQKTFTPPLQRTRRIFNTAYETGFPGANWSNPGTTGVFCVGNTANQGFVRRTNPPAGLFSYLGRMHFRSTLPGQAILIDRLFHCGFADMTGTAAVPVRAPGSTGIPARDANGADLGEGVLLGLEFPGGSGAGAPAYTFTYTDSAGVSGRTMSATAQATETAGAFYITPVQSGVRGVRSLNAMQRSVSHTSGSAGVCLFRILAVLEVRANEVCSIDALTGGMPRIYDDAALQVLWAPASVAAQTIMQGAIQETWG